MVSKAVHRLLCRTFFYSSSPEFSYLKRLLNRTKVEVPNGARCFSSELKVSSLWKEYGMAKDAAEIAPLQEDVCPNAVFVSNELDLDNIDVYGFDYDYTLACYKESLHYLIYNLGRDLLVNKFTYPKEILELNFLPGFATRGLHYDIQKGLLMKIDSFHQIQLGSVYKGLTPVSDEEVMATYKQITLPKTYVDGPFENGKNAPMQHLIDLFSIPEVVLLLNVQQYFENNNISYSPDILFWDVKKAVQSIHPRMHELVEKSIEKYLVENNFLKPYLESLVAAGKKLFLITNSPFTFTDIGLTCLVGPDWQNLFDVVIAKARKPNFFTETSRPFRVYDVDISSQTWESVNHFEKGKVYLEGTLKEFLQKTNWHGRSVLYFGDHVYTDLADVTLHYGWRTGAIIDELADEINNQNTSEYKKTVLWLEQLQHLIETNQDHEDGESKHIVKTWEKERDLLRLKTKAIFNPQFGSLFRTHHNPTYFSRRLFRFADIYMSSITNLLNYSLHHTFYPRRGVLPHESRSKFI